MHDLVVGHRDRGDLTRHARRHPHDLNPDLAIARQGDVT